MAEQRHANGRGSNSLPSIFDICTPRKDVRDGQLESELAADLSRVVEGEAAPEYAEPVKFFAGTYPTKGIKDLLHVVLTRLGGGSSSAVFWLNTSFGGGKTHALIALYHATQSPPIDAMLEFVDPDLRPKERVRVAVFDGQNADISNGHNVGDGIRAHTPWGEIAYRLAGKSGYRKVDDSVSASAPGANTLKELFGDGPVLILLDELAVYLRKAARHRGAGEQLSAFLTALIKAVEGSPNAALVYTLAVGREDDAYSDENRRLMDELKSISSRKTTLLNPTEEGETIHILRRRLFEKRDDLQADAVVDAYRRVWKTNRDKLPDVVDRHELIEEFRAGYPLHPDVLNTLIYKTSTLENFQQIRGMLRILGRVVHELWKNRDKLKPTAIHLHHFDMGNEDMRLEITTKLKQDAFAAAIDADIACDDVNKTSLAQRLDKKHYPDMPPFTTYLTRIIFINTLAYNPPLKGIETRSIRYSMLWPGMEIGYVDEALSRFKDESTYLDDNPEKPTQFQAVPNLSQAIQRAEQSLDDLDLENELDQRMRNMFQKGEFDLHLFPDGHEDVPDDTGSPKLIIPKYAEVSTSNPESPPDMVVDVFRHKGIGKGIRLYRNNLVFLVALEDEVQTMYEAARHHLATLKLVAPDRITDFADYQRKIIRDKRDSSDADLDGALLKCYKYAYYPTKGESLAATIMDWQKSRGQRGLIDRLQDVKKIRMSNDQPDNPESLINRISELKKGEITTLDFRNEFHRSTALPMLVGDRVFGAGVLKGIEMGVFVYKSGELVCGQGDPHCNISIDGNSKVYTTKRAGKLGIWPRKPDKAEGKPDEKDKDGAEGDENEAAPQFDLSNVRVNDAPSLAIRRMLDELRKLDIGKISKMRIESKDNIFPLLSVVGRIRELKAKLEIEGDYEVATDSIFRFEFAGTLKDSEPVQEFLKPQLQRASIGNIRVVLDIGFKEGTDVGWLETLAYRLRLVDNDITVSGIKGAPA